MEATADLFAYRVDGWSPWRVMRNLADRTVSGMPATIPGRSAVRRLAAALGGAVGLGLVLARGRHVDLIVKTARSALREESGGRFSDVYVDPVLARAERGLKIEEDNAPAFAARARRAARPADLDASTFTLFGRVMGRIAPAPVAEFAERARASLLAEFGEAPSAAELQMRVSTVQWQARLFGFLLRRVRPRAVLVTDTGEYGMILACRRAGVPVIELQHGVFGPDHPDAIPRGVGSAAAMLIPTTLASRSQYWIEQLAGTLHGEVAIAVGSDSVDRARQRRDQRSGSATFRIVVSSQGVASEDLAAWLDDAALAAPENLDWDLTVKLHPAYDRQTTAFRVLRRHARVRVVQGAEDPGLMELLADADLHLSISSAAHFDALGLGVPSAVVPLRSWEDVRDAVETGVLVRLESPRDLWSRAWPPLEADVAAHFAQPGFRDRIDALIRHAASGGS